MPSQKSKSARILCISSEKALLETRRLILEANGFQVISATNVLQVQSACREGGISLAVIGHTIPAKMKRALAVLIRELAPASQLLELYQGSPELPEADKSLVNPEPHGLLEAVRGMARSA